MNKNMIEKIISSKNVDDNKVNIDMILINDSIDYKILNGINEINISSNKMEWVFSMDHFVPASTIEFTKKHNNIKKLCEKVKGKFYYGQGIGQNIILERESVTGKLIISNEQRCTILGAVGALAIPVVEKQELIDILAYGKISLENIKVYSFELVGNYQNSSSINDVILFLIKNYKINDNNVIIEFKGEFINNISFSDRINLSSSASEIGALTVIIGVDEISTNYLKQFGMSIEENSVVISDENAQYYQNVVIDVSKITPQIRTEIKESNCIFEKGEVGITIDQGFVGGCSLGIDEFRNVAKLLKNKKVKSSTKLLVSFPTNDMYVMALKEGIVEIFIDSGAIILNSGCGACSGGCQGKIDKNQVFVTTGKYIGNSENEGKIYFHSPNSVVKACIEGHI